MEEPTFTAIDYNSLENRVIEGLVGDYYQMVKNTFETVLYGRIHIPNSPRGLCVDLIEVSRTINIEFNLSNDGIYLWQEVIKPWFTPQRFNLTQEEEEILELTAELWNKFLQLPIYHLMEQSEMQYKIHDIQRMIFRMNKEIFRDYGEG